MHASIKLSLYKNANTLKLTYETICLDLFLHKLFVYFHLNSHKQLFPVLGAGGEAHILYTQTSIILTKFLIICICYDIGGGLQQAIIF